MGHDRASLVKVTIKREDGMLFAKSADLEGLFVCAATNEQLSKRLMQAIAKLASFTSGVEVRVDPVLEGGATASDRPIDKFIVHYAAA
ncbi:DUF1902 domain-containing protein [Burkholderia cenocepacia]|uniref:DUF1902 domain-containing protein n=1 Tax=Burkholderia cenocepacia TaxID=95486 RepID=UPI002AB052E5|nr:DUF1902 domain-containing protein [Burkholderia cenocepacia]